jgi:hypothetical protein
VISSNEVVSFATSILKRLAKDPRPLDGITPIVRYEGRSSEGKEIPFYRIRWPVKNSSFGDAAEMEIDARKPEVEALYLAAPWFFDPGKTREIVEKVYTADPPKPKLRPKPVGKRIVPYPTTNQVTVGIEHWLAFCKRLNLNPGGDTNISDIDWEKSVVYTNLFFSGNRPVAQVRFKNGACFECVDGLVYSHFGPDACFTGFWDRRPEEEWKPFEGRVTVRWEDQASDFVRFVSQKLGVPLKTLKNLRQWPFNKAADVGTEGIARMVVRWYKCPPNQFCNVLDLPSTMACEFDLRDGKVKWFEIDPKLIGLSEK